MVIGAVNFHQPVRYYSARRLPRFSRLTCISAAIMPVVKIASPRDHKLLPFSLSGIIFACIVPVMKSSSEDMVEAGTGDKAFVSRVAGW